MLRPSAAVTTAFVLAACYLPEVPALAQGARAGNVRVVMRANPGTVPADAKSRAVIRIEVRDQQDRPVLDGTPIFCHTSLGLLSTGSAGGQEAMTVSSSGGFATVYATSDTPGAAVVSASVQESRGEVVVQFLPEGEVAQRYARVVDVKGAWVAYCVELNQIRARDGARAKVGSLVFQDVDRLEVRVDELTVRGWGGEISLKGETVDVEEFFYDLGASRGVFRRFSDEGVEWVRFNQYLLHDSGPEWDIPQDAFRPDERDNQTWFVCRGAQFFIGQKVVVKHATVYVEDQKVFSFPPYWVIGLAGYTGASNTQTLGLSSRGGLAVDFPYFYRVTDGWSGSVRIRKGASGTSFVARDGWSVGVTEEYDDGIAKGFLEADGLGRPDWGLQWQDERPILGDSQGFFNVSWPDHRSLFADASIYRYQSSYRFNLRGQYDNPWNGAESMSMAGEWLTEPRTLGPTYSYRLGTMLGARRQLWDDKGWVMENELYASLDIDPWRLSSRTQLRPSLSHLYAWDTSKYAQNASRAEFRLDHTFTPSTRMGLNYYLTYRTGQTSRYGVNHLLGLNFTTASGGKWSSYLNASYDLTEDDRYASLGFDYYPSRGWRLGLLGTHYSYADAEFSDVELELAKALGNKELGLRYSIDSGRLSLELGGFGLGR